MSDDMTSEVMLSIRNMTKHFPGVVALDDVSLEFLTGEVHAIIGENGAGKSTLIKTISGALQPDEGVIALGGKEYRSLTPTLAISLGVEVVYQEFNLVDTLGAAENISLGEKSGILFNRRKTNEKARAIFKRFKIDINPNTPVRDLSPAMQQIVEIAKAVSRNVKILVLDEPTAPLTINETEILFEIVKSLKRQGVTVIYISHRLDEIFGISDRVSILRDGKYVATFETARTDRHELISLMVGRELSESYPARVSSPQEESLRVEGLATEVVRNISFSLRKGEILGISGLVGSGRTETARAIFGADKKIAGSIYVYGKKAEIKSPTDAIRLGLGLIPEDRKRHGVFLGFSILWNNTIMALKSICTFSVINKHAEQKIAAEYREKLKIRTPNLFQQVKNLSGGNQQKVVLAKTLAANSDIIIFDEPTRGIDVGARYEIYLLMNRLAEEGRSILMITSDMEELLGMSDRIIVFYEGGIAGEIRKEDFSQTRVLELASGGA